MTWSREKGGCGGPSLHLVFLGTLVLGFTMFLAELVLFTALLFLAGAPRLLALIARGLLPPGGRPPGQAEAAAPQPGMNSVLCPPPPQNLGPTVSMSASAQGEDR
ncbi:hypothetical protein [Arthrobacter sp. UYCu723]